ncbi:hypothetical protein BJ138DRAFT_1105763 [Hygrophoropsis aurantiaca]|uniref:Uncharacterized protein n=1 Tax=Hygrophoropsis aurantiaca TaxID=72124 RepID=A0ACB7ZXV4_9AGAM|nr:hypothetical protein BJ138DRAFT_1105763 [Hygrophoropsis aurantiaca]
MVKHYNLWCCTRVWSLIEEIHLVLHTVVRIFDLAIPESNRCYLPTKSNVLIVQLVSYPWQDHTTATSHRQSWYAKQQAAAPVSAKRVAGDSAKLSPESEEADDDSNTVDGLQNMNVPLMKGGPLRGIRKRAKGEKLAQMWRLLRMKVNVQEQSPVQVRKSEEGKVGVSQKCEGSWEIMSGGSQKTLEVIWRIEKTLRKAMKWSIRNDD